METETKALEDMTDEEVLAEMKRRREAKNKDLTTFESGGIMTSRGEQAGVKEPWQMTREQYIEPKMLRENLTKSTTGWKWIGHNSLYSPRNENQATDMANGIIREYQFEHKELISKALSEGKPVPPEVLKDYPDLQPKPTSVEPAGVKEGATELPAQVPGTPEAGVQAGKAIKPKAKPTVYNKLITKIKKADDTTKKTKIWQDADLTRDQYEQVVREMILSLPKGYYKLHDREYGTNLVDAVYNAFGWMPSMYVDQRMMLGLQALHEDKVYASFTHGLDVVELKNPKPTKQVTTSSRKAIETPKAVQLPTVAKTSLLDAQDERSNRAKAIDDARLHSKVVSQDSPQVKRWLRHPGSMDVQGVDTPSNRIARITLHTPKLPRAKPVKVKANVGIPVSKGMYKTKRGMLTRKPIKGSKLVHRVRTPRRK